MYKILFVALIALLCAGCNFESVAPEKWETDQKLRREIFKECMKLLPAGPQETKYNDWDEVVAECDNVAYYQSRYCAKNCK
jgi:hypothetical protein